MGSELSLPVVRFSCRACDRKLKAQRRDIGAEFKCPRCRVPVIVPPRSTRPASPVLVMTEFMDGDKAAGTVPVKLGLPKVGTIETKVTQRTADSMASTFLGGLLVAIGVILAGMFGVKARA